jgi:hypothetical protein
MQKGNSVRPKLARSTAELGKFRILDEKLHGRNQITAPVLRTLYPVHTDELKKGSTEIPKGSGEAP